MGVCRGRILRRLRGLWGGGWRGISWGRGRRRSGRCDHDRIGVCGECGLDLLIVIP